MEMKQMKKQMRLLLCCLIFVLMASGVSFTAEAATPKKTKLTQDEETHTFSNAKDGSFRYDYAVKSDYYRGVAVDESTWTGREAGCREDRGPVTCDIDRSEIDK